MPRYAKGKKPKQPSKHPCECCDKGCPVHPGAHCTRAACCALDRVDMQRWAGDPAARVEMCAPCADDAMASGVFGNQRPRHWR